MEQRKEKKTKKKQKNDEDGNKSSRKTKEAINKLWKSTWMFNVGKSKRSGQLVSQEVYMVEENVMY